MQTTGLRLLADASVLTPELLTSVATLVTALTGLLVAMRAGQAGRRTGARVEQAASQSEANAQVLHEVREQGNGTISRLHERIFALEDQARAAGLPPLTPADALHAATAPPSGA